MQPESRAQSMFTHDCTAVHTDNFKPDNKVFILINKNNETGYHHEVAGKPLS